LVKGATSSGCSLSGNSSRVFSAISFKGLSSRETERKEGAWKND
jgi:hypothetical protein